MFLIITKWTPLVPDAKYLSFFSLEEAYRNDNLNPDGTNIVDPSKYNKQVYETWVNSVFNYKDLLMLNSNFSYQFLEDENSNVVFTVQAFENRHIYDSISVTETYINHQQNREALNQILQISSEIKKFEIDIPVNVLTDYYMVDTLFGLY